MNESRPVENIAAAALVRVKGFFCRAGIILTFTILAVLAVGGAWMFMLPGSSHKGPLPPLGAGEAEAEVRLREHVTTLAGTIGERNTRRYHALQRAADYISERFVSYGFRVEEKAYMADGVDVKNIVTEIAGTVRPAEIVIIGAHYDSPPGSPGADDNASGVAALLELARRFSSERPARTLRFVAFTNEEPPYFQTSLMGSLVYAREAKKRNEKIVAMLSLESIGYYSDAPGSQLYPFPLSLFYPDTGNFIGFVGNLRSRTLLYRAVGTFRKSTPFPTEGITSPEFIDGIGWSDHWSFWREGYPALMVTGTALFRNPHYHQPTDTPDRLDFGRMARVVGGLEQVVRELVK